MKTKAIKFLSAQQNKGTDAVLTVIMILVSAIIFGICIINGMGNDIWYDEVFSVKFMEYGYGEITALTASDVHPPVYYWYLKAFCDIGKLMVPDASYVVLAKMASVLPFVGIWIYALTLICKRMGFSVAALFLFFIGAMPQISNYTVEIRMYALALFCVTAMFLHSYEIIFENKKRHWIAFWCFGIITAYIQYYACVAVIAVYIALFVYFFAMKEKLQLRKLILCAGISVVAYLPWIPSFISQVKNVSNNYWIQPLTFRSIFGCIKYIFLPVASYAGVKNYILAILMIGIFGSFYLYALWKEKDLKVRYLLLSGIFIPVFVAITGFIASALNRPIFVYRYLISGLGAVWLVAAYVLLKYRKELIVLLALIPFLIAGKTNMDGFVAEESKKISNMHLTDTFLEAFPEEGVILCNFNHVQALAAYYLDNEVVLYGGEPESLIGKLMPNCIGMPEVEQIKELVAKDDVYFFGSFNAREDLLKEWKQYGITYTEDGTFLLERYWFNVYHLKFEE